MTKPDKNIFGCCKVEAVVTVDERGQMVLPKEIREKAKIKAGDKLTVVTGENNGKIYCIALIKAEELEETVRSILGTLSKQTSR